MARYIIDIERGDEVVIKINSSNSDIVEATNGRLMLRVAMSNPEANELAHALHKIVDKDLYKAGIRIG